MLGLGAKLQSDDSCVTITVFELLKDLVDAYNFCYCGQDDDKYEHKVNLDNEQRPGQKKDMPIGANPDAPHTTMDRRTPCTLAELARGIGATISDHGETSLKNGIVPMMRELASERRHMLSFLCCLRRNNRRDYDQMGAEGRELLVRGLFGDKVVDFDSRSRFAHFYCDFHKLMCSMKRASQEMARVEQEEMGDDVELGNLLQDRNGSWAMMLIHSICKMFGNGVLDESLSIGVEWAKLREAAGATKVYFERLIGSRAEAGFFGCALACLTILQDDSDWGMKSTILALKRLSKKSTLNGLANSLYLAKNNKVLQACLRVMVLLNTAIFRPLNVYFQNPKTSKRDTIQVWNELKTLLEQLKDVDDEMLWQDLPWCGDGVLVRIATHERVMRVPTAQPHNATEKQIEMWNTRYDKTVERRNTAIAVASSMEDTEELQLANKLLKAAVTGMLKSFNDIHSERYNGRILTTTDADLLLLAESVPSTSDAVEKFLGLVSYLEASNRNQGPLNRFYQLLAREMKISEKLQDLRAKDPDFVHTAMNRGRTFKLILAERVAERADKALDRRKKDIEHHLARESLRPQVDCCETSQRCSDGRSDGGLDPLTLRGPRALGGLAMLTRHQRSGTWGCWEDSASSTSMAERLSRGI